MPAILVLLRQFWPYIVAFGLGLSSGFGGAWKIQGYRITDAKQEFAQYKHDQQEAAIAAREEADKQREKDAADYAKLSGILDNEINSGVVYRRCVAAGRCGVRKQSCPVQTVTVPPTSGANETSSDAISTGQEPADKLANECAETTLLLNRLQISISSQPGWVAAILPK